MSRRRRKNELQDANDFSVLLASNGGWLKSRLSKNEMAILRRVAKLHLELLKAHMCGCCVRMLAQPRSDRVCDECACGAHQTDCPASRKAHMAFECIDCGKDFWMHEDKGRQLTSPPVCDPCRERRLHPVADAS